MNKILTQIVLFCLMYGTAFSMEQQMVQSDLEPFIIQFSHKPNKTVRQAVKADGFSWWNSQSCEFFGFSKKSPKTIEESIRKYTQGEGINDFSVIALDKGTTLESFTKRTKSTKESSGSSFSGSSDFDSEHKDEIISQAEIKLKTDKQWLGRAENDKKQSDSLLGQGKHEAAARFYAQSFRTLFDRFDYLMSVGEGGVFLNEKGEEIKTLKHLQIGGKAEEKLNSIKEQGRIQEVETLNLSQSDITLRGIKLLAEADHLKALDISSAAIIGKRTFSFLPKNLECLFLENVGNIKGSLSLLEPLKNLQFLGLSGTNLTQEDLNGLKSMTEQGNLKYVDLSMSYIDGQPLNEELLKELDGNVFLILNHQVPKKNLV